MSWWAAPTMTGVRSRRPLSSSTARPARRSPPSIISGSLTRPGTTPATTTITWRPATCPPARSSASSAPAPGSGCRTFPPTATPTASRLIRLTTTSSCRCLRAAAIANPSRRTAAWVCTPRSSFQRREGLEGSAPAAHCGGAPGRGRLADQGLLVAHHLPLAAAAGPQLADEDPAETQRRGARKLHAALVRDESVIRTQRLHLEELQQVAGVHAVLDLAQHVQSRALALAIGFHGLEVVGEKLCVAGAVLVLERFPRSAHLSLEQCGKRGRRSAAVGRRSRRRRFIRRDGLLCRSVSGKRKCQRCRCP